MADKNYKITFELSDGSEKSVEFTAPQGEPGENGKNGEDGYSPIKGVDYFDGKDGKDGKDYVLTNADKEEIASKVPYVKVAEHPIFVDSVDEMTDISKMYVLKSDGMFYSYKAHTTTTPGGTVANFTNKVPTSIDANGAIYNGCGYKGTTRLSSSGSEKEATYCTVFGYIPVSGGDTIRFTGQEHNGADVLWYDTESETSYICVYDKDFKFLYAGLPKGGYSTNSFVESMSVDGVVSVIKLKDVANIAYFRMNVRSGYSASGIAGESAIITVNEEITYTTTEESTTTTYSWESTGISYNQPADYEHRVIAMENELEVLLNGTF